MSKLNRKEAFSIIYIGIDIAKLNHFASIISPEGEVLAEPCKFTNDNDDFYLLVSKLNVFDKISIVIGLKSTAHTAATLLTYLLIYLLGSKGYKVYLINPIQTAVLHKNNIRKTNIDKVDIFVIAKTVLLMDRPRFVTLGDIELMQLKNLGRFRQKIVKQLIQLKIQVTSYMDQIFPEFQYFFKSILHHKTCYTLSFSLQCTWALCRQTRP